MNEALAPPVPQTRLKPFGAGWVSAYRALWCLLAFCAFGLLGASLFQPIAHPAILALRLLKGAVVISVCGILFRRRRDDPVAALLSLAFLTWTITSSFDFASTNALPMLLDRVRFLLFALALLLFPDGQWRPRWTRGVAAASTAVFLLGLAEGVRIAPTRLFLPLAIGCVVAAVIALVSRFRTAQSEAVRQQLKWVALGLVAGIGLILTARAGAALASISPSLHAVPVLWEALFQLGIAIIALGFLVSLLRYRLFDAETAISRSAAFAGLTVALVATFAGTEASIEWVGQQYLGMGIGSNISAAMAAAVAAVLLSPFHSRISDWAEHRFQRDLVLLKRDLPQVLDDLAAGATPSQVGAAVLSRINQAVHATRSALVAPGGVVIAANGVSLKDARRWSREMHKADALTPCDRADALFPIRVELAGRWPGGVGWVVLGPRPDGSLYGKEDLDAIESVRPSIRHAMAWATARETTNNSQRRQWQALRREVSELRHGLVVAKADGKVG